MPPDLPSLGTKSTLLKPPLSSNEDGGGRLDLVSHSAKILMLFDEHNNLISSLKIFLVAPRIF